MKYAWVVFVAFMVIGECSRSYPSGSVTTNCVNRDVDEYLDQVIHKGREELDDPMRLPPKSSVVELSDGLLWGMSELKRVGNADVTCEGNIITIQGRLTVDQLKARYTWTKKRWGNRSDLQGFVLMISDDFEAEFTLIIEKKENEETHPRLERFVINRLKKMHVEMTGMGIFTWTLAELTTLLSGIFQRAIAAAIQDPIKEALERQMREISLH